MMKSIVLLSAGLDSTVNFCKALREGEIALAITFDYGQRAAKQEISRAKSICSKYHVKHQVIDVPWLKQITKTALVNTDSDLPKLKSSELDHKTKTLDSAQKVWVPNRNGVFINIAASFAEVLGVSNIVVGFNAEEAVSFPDNSSAYVEKVNDSLSYSTLSKPRVVCFTQNLKKQEIVQFGQELDAPFDLMWSCYEANEKLCGTCESCLRYFRAMRNQKNANHQNAIA